MSERLISLDMIIVAVEAATGLTRREILSDRKMEELADARFAIWWLASKLTLLTTVEIGRQTNRDHSTVVHGIRRADELRAGDRGFCIATDAVLDTLLALERTRQIALAATVDPIAVATRIAARPEREAVRVSTEDIIAMARELIALHGAQSHEETENAA